MRRKLPVLPTLLPGTSKTPKLPLFLRRFTWVDLRAGLKGDPWDRLIWGITGEEPLNQAAPRLPPLTHCFGRDAEVETLVSTLCAEPPRPVPILGPGGVGKTTVTVAALHHRRVVERFGARRWFVRCDSATSRDALVGEIATGLGLETAGQLEEPILREIERRPAVLVLDNAETPWEGDLVKVEQLLVQLGGLPGLALAASIRGDERPLGPAWTEAIRVRPLALPDARSAFLAVAGDCFRDDPELDRLLGGVDGLPLAVTLLAWQAQAYPDLSALWSRWHRERTALLSRGSGRLLSLETSLEISVHGPRMTDEARQLLGLLGALPDGVAHQDLEALLPGIGESAAATLRRVGLAFSQGDRLRVLAPVREHAGHRHPPSTEDLERARGFYLELATLGGKVGYEGGLEAVSRLSPETGNLEAMILRSLVKAEPIEAMAGVLGMARLYRWTGLGSPICVEQALSRARKSGDLESEAKCLLWLGNISRRRWDYAEASVALYEEALPLFRRIGDVRGEGDCLRGLGSQALSRSDYAAARARYNNALSLARGVGDVHREANAIGSLGDIALRRSEHRAARARYEKALALFRHIGDILGQANCIQRLGDISLKQSDHAAARARYEEALPLFRRVGDIRSEANCIRSLGDIALARTDHEAARVRYKEGLPLYRRVGEILGEAHCIQGLGDIAFACSDHAAARMRYEEALALFRRVWHLLGEASPLRGLGDIDRAHGKLASAKSCFGEALPLWSRIPDHFSIGGAHARLARVAKVPEEKRRHVAAAREAWTRIKRPDLIEELEREFGSHEMEGCSSSLEPADPTPTPSPTP